MGPRVAMPNPWAKTTIPTALLLPAISNATTLWTIMAMKKATKEVSVPNQRTRKLRI